MKNKSRTWKKTAKKGKSNIWEKLLALTFIINVMGVPIISILMVFQIDNQVKEIKASVEELKKGTMITRYVITEKEKVFLTFNSQGWLEFFENYEEEDNEIPSLTIENPEELIDFQEIRWDKWYDNPWYDKGNFQEFIEVGGEAISMGYWESFDRINLNLRNEENDEWIGAALSVEGAKEILTKEGELKYLILHQNNKTYAIDENGKLYILNNF